MAYLKVAKILKGLLTRKKFFATMYGDRWQTDLLW